MDHGCQALFDASQGSNLFTLAICIWDLLRLPRLLHTFPVPPGLWCFDNRGISHMLEAWHPMSSDDRPRNESPYVQFPATQRLPCHVDLDGSKSLPSSPYLRIMLNQIRQIFQATIQTYP